MVGYFPNVPKEQMTLSSDSNGSQPVWNDKKEIIGITAAKMDTLYGTIRSLVDDFHLDFSEALQFATVNVAKALKLYPQKGTVQKDSDGDLVLLDDNNNIDTVIAKGQILMQNQQILVKGLFE